ncbi:DUF3093 domain-containing protein [Jatrophihabitans endophyticus]|uniref:DUF3093 domain-containing protein n=1 Tax=Jatrophihabitans endophyticus TaxID=1206085 RepID=UPI0019F80174|nr:DUF3093 domain-containing protein [Jatrophihabitans endophyticus]MBE7190099.1 DUF3093 domain-containing protein [Jatrophihabitans endophyticus]
MPGSRQDAVYSEALRAPVWWYAVGLVVAAILGAEFHVSGVPLTDWIPYCVLGPLAVGIVFAVGRSRLEVVGGEIRIRGAHLPLEHVSGLVGLDRRTMRLVVGREGDPAAYVQVRPWIGPGVQFWIDDENDPTPYWVVSTRHPEQLVAAVNTVR